MSNEKMHRKYEGLVRDENKAVDDKLVLCTADICPHGTSSTGCEWCNYKARIPHLESALQAANTKVERMEKAVEATREIMSNVALDWYVQHFGKDTTPNGAGSGIAAHIHNQGVQNRAAIAFERARKALAAMGDGG